MRLTLSILFSFVRVPLFSKRLSVLSEHLLFYTLDVLLFFELMSYYGNIQRPRQFLRGPPANKRHAGQAAGVGVG